MDKQGCHMYFQTRLDTRARFGLTVERGIVPLQEYCEPACLLTQSNEAGTNDYPL